PSPRAPAPARRESRAALRPPRWRCRRRPPRGPPRSLLRPRSEPAPAPGPDPTSSTAPAPANGRGLPRPRGWRAGPRAPRGGWRSPPPSRKLRVHGEGGLHHAIGRKSLLVALAARAAPRGAPRGVFEGLDEGGGEGIRVARRDEPSRDPVRDRFRDAAGGGGDHGNAEGHGVEQAGAEPLHVGGKAEDGEGGDQAVEVVAKAREHAPALEAEAARMRFEP